MECITKPVKIQGNECRITDRFYVDDDMNVPDTKKDVKKVILSEGILSVEEIKEIDAWIKQVRIDLKKNIIKKQNREINSKEIYSYMHDIFGAEIIDVFDLKEEEEQEQKKEEE